MTKSTVIIPSGCSEINLYSSTEPRNFKQATVYRYEDRMFHVEKNGYD